MDPITVILILVIVFLFGKGTLNGITGLPATTFSTVATPADPVPAALGAPATPQSTQFATAELNTEVSASVSAGTQAASIGAKLAGASSTFASAIPIVGAAVAAVAQVLLAQHTARLQGAVKENELIPQSVQAFDADVAQIVTAFNSGQATAEQCITALQQMNTSLYNFMKSNATGPGRAWRDATPGGPIAPQACNSGCTTECCVYWNDLYVAIFGGTNLGGGMSGLISALQGISKSGSTTTGGSACPYCAYIPEVYPPPSQYGNFSRAAYIATFIPPAKAA